MATQTTAAQHQLETLLEENREGLLTCVHCGLCLPACPTYKVLGNENDSPRGRVYLMRALVEGRLEPGESYVSHIDLCLGCRACESVCPSGVPYGQLLEAARPQIAHLKASGFSAVSLATKFVLNQVFTRSWLLNLCLTVTRWFRDSGLAWLAFDSGLVKGRLKFALALLLASRPTNLKSATVKPVAMRTEVAPPNTEPVTSPPEPAESKPVRVGLLRGCVMDGLFASTNRATLQVLTANGCSIVDVTDQACCGALHAHAGEIETARQLARRNIDAFLAADVDRVVVNAAGCGAAMKEYAHLLKDDATYKEKAARFSASVQDISEIYAERHMHAPAEHRDCRVAYDAPCHLLHAQKVAAAPVDMLKSVPGVRLVPLAGSENCCGGAGIYNLLHPDLSGDILDAKLDAIVASGAEVVATGNPGCLMQIGAGLLCRGIAIPVMHPVDIVAPDEHKHLS
ncbi:MAG TPA: heterodisulfide reductase-related iron-sulfur binding cluster [Blastocatellia bacterium]